MALDALEGVLSRQLSLCGPCSSAAGDVQFFHRMLLSPFHKFDGYRSSGGKLVIKRK